MTRTKKFASKPNFRGNIYVCAKKDTDVSEKGQLLSDQSGESTCVKCNLTPSNEKTHGSAVNLEIKVGENNFCKSENNFIHDGTNVVSINLFYAFTHTKKNCEHCVGNISFLKIHHSGKVL
jgi:hypothetical protein